MCPSNSDQALVLDRQTDRQTRPTLYTTQLREWSKIKKTPCVQSTQNAGMTNDVITQPKAGTIHFMEVSQCNVNRDKVEGEDENISIITHM